MKKFMFIAPYTPLTTIHINRPYFELLKAMNRKNWLCILLAGKIETKCPDNILPLETGITSNKHLDIFRTFPIVMRYLSEQQPDVILFFHMNLILPIFVSIYKLKNNILKSKKKRGIKPIWIIKLDWDGTKFDDLNKFVMKLRNIFLLINSFFVDYIIAENSCSYLKTREIIGTHNKKIVKIPNSYSNEFPLLEYENGKRENIILCVARVEPEKDILSLVRSFAHVSKQFPSWSLKIVGPTDNINYFDEVTLEIKKLGLEKYTTFTGPLYKNDLLEIYSRASIFCLASSHETFSIARAEAIASGIPIITTTSGCGIDFIEYGCIVTPVGDVESMSRSLNELIIDKEKRVQISKLQQSKYPNYDKIAEQYENIIINKRR